MQTKWEESNHEFLLALLFAQVLAKQLSAFCIAEHYIFLYVLPFVKLFLWVNFRFYLHNYNGIALRIEKPSKLIVFELSPTLSNEALQLPLLEDVPDYKAY